MLPDFEAAPPTVPQGQFAVAIRLDDEEPSRFLMGAAAAPAIYTGGGGFAALRKIEIRAYSWLNFVYPLPF